MRGFFLFGLLFLLYCTIGTLAVTEHHRCMHDNVSMFAGTVTINDISSTEVTPQSNTGVSGSSPTVTTTIPTDRTQPDSGWEPIRIKFFTIDLDASRRFCSNAGETVIKLRTQPEKCTAMDILTPEKKSILVDEILPKAIELHSERLFVQRLKGPIRVPEFNNRSLCSNFTIPDDHKSTGVPEADMVLYVAASPTPKGTFAWAATCATLAPEGRPVVGIINYSPRYIESTPQHIRVAAHEIAHALGFSVGLMKGKNIVSSGVTLRDNVNIGLVKSAHTLREAKRHYNCETMEGMELQNVTVLKRTEVPKKPGGKNELQKSQNAKRLALLDQVASVQGEYHLRQSHSNTIDGRFNSKDSAGSAVKERSKEEGSRYTKGKHSTPFSSDALLKRSSLHLRTAMTAAEEPCNPEKEVKSQADERKCIVEKTPSVPKSEETIPGSHWSRRIAKDELMVGLVGAGYYTALTMGLFADLGYYKVNWTKAEEMSWGNNSECELLTGKCVENGNTKYPNMFCTTDHSDSPEALRCTSDRQSLGSCTITTKTVELQPQYQYFSEANKLGSEESERMDYCPFIAALPERSCLDGVQNDMPGSRIGKNSRCVQGKELKANDKPVGAVCVEVSCKFDKVSVRYSGDRNWYNCSEGDNLTVQGETLKGEIVCPKYADVCNTINRTLDELQGLQTYPEITPEVETTTATSPENVQPTTEVTNTQSTNEGATASGTKANKGVVEPVVQNGANKDEETDTGGSKETSNISPVNLQKNNTPTNKSADGSFVTSAFVSVMFVFFSVSLIMAP